MAIASPGGTGRCRVVPSGCARGPSCQVVSAGAGRQDPCNVGSSPSVVANSRSDDLTRGSTPEIYGSFWQYGAFSTHLMAGP